MFKAMDFSDNDPLLAMKTAELGSQLAALQRELKDTDRSLLIILSGWEATGKGQLLLDGTPAQIRCLAGENLPTEESVADLYRRFGI